MYTAVRLDGYATVIKGSESTNDYAQICRVPKYYINDLGIAEVIARTLNESNKYILDLNV